jgi:hypothetical protein
MNELDFRKGTLEVIRFFSPEWWTASELVRQFLLTILFGMHIRPY